MKKNYSSEAFRVMPVSLKETRAAIKTIALPAGRFTASIYIDVHGDSHKALVYTCKLSEYRPLVEVDYDFLAPYQQQVLDVIGARGYGPEQGQYCKYDDTLFYERVCVEKRASTSTNL